MTDLHTAITLGIERGLANIGGELSNCTPSMLAHSVIAELRNAGPDLFAEPATLPGRVFLPGDHIPGDLVVIAEHGVIYAYDANEQSWDDIGGPVVEIPLPSEEKWQAAVNRALAEREASHG